MTQAIDEILKICDAHANRLNWTKLLTRYQ